MAINDDLTLRLKVGQLNTIFKEVQEYKRRHPEKRNGYYPNVYGSLLNAYREGDLTFDECIELLGKVRPTEELIAEYRAEHGLDG